MFLCGYLAIIWIQLIQKFKSLSPDEYSYVCLILFYKKPDYKKLGLQRAKN